MGTASLTQHLANHTQHHHIVLVTVSSGTSVSLILQKWNLRPREVLWLSEDTELEGGVLIYLATTGCSRCLLLFQAAANAPNYQDVNTFHSGSNTGHASHPSEMVRPFWGNPLKVSQVPTSVRFRDKGNFLK